MVLDFLDILTTHVANVGFFLGQPWGVENQHYSLKISISSSQAVLIGSFMMSAKVLFVSVTTLRYSTVN